MTIFNSIQNAIIKHRYVPSLVLRSFTFKGVKDLVPVISNNSCPIFKNVLWRKLTEFKRCMGFKFNNS